MRNIFDQYKQPENQLSHALASCLNEDRALLHELLNWLRLSPPMKAEKLFITEQSLPGDPPRTEEDSGKRGLPDIIIHDDLEWCIVIESKVEAPLTRDQLDRHFQTLSRRGFRKVHCVALTKRGAKVPKGVIGITWCDLYARLGTHRMNSKWARHLRDYLQVAENRLTESHYLTEGTLTMFDGFRFSPENPYTYREAKRLLNLATAELRKSRDLDALGADTSRKGRPAIKGDNAPYVWDFIYLRSHPKGKSHRVFPHLTLSVHTDHLEVAISIPNGIARVVRNRLSNLGVEGLAKINQQILRRAASLTDAGATVEAFALQRHYRTQSSHPTLDASMQFKLDTYHGSKKGRIKSQSQWLDLFVSLITNKKSNLHFAYAIQIPWGTKGLDSRASLDLIIKSWTSLQPLLDAICKD